MLCAALVPAASRSSRKHDAYRSSTLVAADLYCSSGPHCAGVNHRQPKSPTRLVRRRVERLNRSARHTSPQARTGVTDGQQRVIAARQRRLKPPAVLFVQSNGFSGNCDVPLVAHRLGGVQNTVENNLLQLRPIESCKRTRAEDELKVDILSHGAVYERIHAGNLFVKQNRDGAPHLRLHEGMKSLDELVRV